MRLFPIGLLSSKVNLEEMNAIYVKKSERQKIVLKTVRSILVKCMEYIVIILLNCTDCITRMCITLLMCILLQIQLHFPILLRLLIMRGY
jgi:hypothetical protein